MHQKRREYWGTQRKVVICDQITVKYEIFKEYFFLKGPKSSRFEETWSR